MQSSLCTQAIASGGTPVESCEASLGPPLLLPVPPLLLLLASPLLLPLLPPLLLLALASPAPESVGANPLFSELPPAHPWMTRATTQVKEEPRRKRRAGRTVEQRYDASPLRLPVGRSGDVDLNQWGYSAAAPSPQSVFRYASRASS